MNKFMILGRGYILRPMLAEAALSRDLHPEALATTAPFAARAEPGPVSLILRKLRALFA